MVRLQEVEVTEPRTSAQSMAPTDSRLEATQPESIINLQTIQNSIAPTADYAMIAALAPSVTNFSTNGPGLNESKPTLRGFNDGQYNVTIDGIPFGDGNDYTHHTTSYFPAKLLGRVTVDRGPGGASTIGMATFGGTMALETKDPRNEASFVPTLSYGSWKTRLAHFEANTGLLPKTNGGSLIASYQYMDSDGYRTFGTLRRNTYFFKYIQPIGKSTTLSFMGEYNNIKFNNPNASPLTGQQILTLGRNFGQTNDPLDRNGDYYGSNYQVKQTDTGFVALDSDLGGGWRLNDKIYTFSYNNSSHESPANNGGSTIVAGKVVTGTDLAGRFKVNSVRSVGNTLAVSHDDPVGSFKTGVWFDYQHGPRYQYALDYNVANAQKLGMVAMPAGYLDPLAPSTKGGYVYNMHFYTRTWEPYVEYQWRPIQNLTLTPGLKYMWIQRVIEAPINQTKNLLPAFYGQVYSKTLPLVTANYRLSSHWSTYAQVASGMLTPPLAYFQEDNPQKNSVKPQTTTNYQIGTVYKTNRFNADFDGYFIRSKNLPISIVNPDQTGIPNANDLITYTASGAYYYGVEAQGTFYAGSGLSLFANASRNYGTLEKSKRRIDGLSESTAGYGFIYDHAGFFTSLMSKYSGPYTTYVGAPNPDQPLPASALTVVQGGFTMYDLSLGYGQKLQGRGFLKSYKARLQINNLFNRDVILLKAAKATAGKLNPLTSTYNPLVTRGYFLTVSTEF
ncbi:MAG: TonB-dependent receptor [Verrucomicrobia bacterium]|nr:TonB-dependent receptor [Verrucomicrobiota bacterium]